ncbi:MAG: polysaccharide biosynthesis tyrosine autokinase [Ferruginibacter sp.]
MQITRKISEEREVNLVKRLIFLYRPYWPLFVFLTVLFIGLAYLYLRIATPVYETTARILVKDEKKGVEESKTVESLDGFSGKKIIENEIEVIKSPALMDEVVAKLHLYAPVFEEKSFKSVSAYTTSPVIMEIEDLENIKKVPRIDFVFDDKNKKVIIGKNEYPLDEFVTSPYGKIKFLNNPHYQKERVPNTKYFFTLLPFMAVSNAFNSSLSVTSPNKLSSIIYLKYQDQIPERSEDILNALLISYNNATLSDKNILTTNTLDFIDERLKLLKNDLDSTERKIQRFKSRNDAVDISTQGKLFLENVSNNDQRLGEINMQLAVLGQVDKYVTSKNSSSGIVPSTLGVNDPTLSLLVNKLYSSELEYEKIKRTAGENNPVAVTLNDQIEKIRPGILENIQSQRKSLEASRRNLASTNNSFSSTIQAMPEKERQLIDINREQGTKNQIYNFLLQKREETALSQASTVSNNRLVDKARTSDKAVSPKGKVIYLSSLLLALLSGIGIVTAKDKLRGKIMFVHEIEDLTSYPVIGEITEEKKSKNPIVIGEGKRTLIAEQFRKIRASLTYLGINSAKKRILITSSISGEGKSFVAVNLALSLAMAGKKVALLDFDLNNPSLNNKLSVRQNKGITEFLRNECSAGEIIIPTDHHENLFLLPTGDLPSNPAELIMSDRTEQLLNYLDNKFDCIVIDVAPVGPVTDAYLLSPFCDATLYIIRHSYTPKLFIERIEENNKIHNLKNIGIVFNGIGTRGFGKNYEYGYGYHTSGGYVYESKKPKLLPPVIKKSSAGGTPGSNN